MDDSKLYLIATREFEDDRMNSAAWAKAIALGKGDKKKAKWEYIEIRVQQFRALGNDIAQSGQQSTEQGKKTRATVSLPELTNKQEVARSNGVHSAEFTQDKAPLEDEAYSGDQQSGGVIVGSTQSRLP